MDGPADASTHSGLVVSVEMGQNGGAGPADGSGLVDGPVVVHQTVTVVDHGTGLGAELAGVLTLSPSEAQAAVARSTGIDSGRPPSEPPSSPDGVGVAEVSLRRHGHDEDLVEVAATGVGGFVDSAYRRTTLADSLLNRFTRARLDADTVNPRLHGGAVADPDGRGVLVLGSSGSGKSTLVASLAASGLHLLNDEQVAVFRSAEMVAGFTRPVAVKPGGGVHLPAAVRPDVPDVDHTQLVSADTLGTVHALTARPVLIVLPDRFSASPPARGEDAVRWTVLEPGQALEELCANNLDLVTRPAEGLAAFAWLAATVPVVRLHYADVADAVPVVVHMLGEPPAIDPLEWSVTKASDENDPPVVGAGDVGFDAVVRVADAVQTVRLGSQVFLFHPESRQLVELNGSGGALWDTLPWPDLAVDDPDLAAVTGFALDLVERGMVKLAGAPAVTYRRVDGLVHRRIRGRVLVSDRQHAITTLEGSSAVVWDMLATPADLITLLARIRADQPDEVDPAAHEADRVIDGPVADGDAMDAGAMGGDAMGGNAMDGNDPDPLARAEMARMVDEALAGLIGVGLVEPMDAPPSPAPAAPPALAGVAARSSDSPVRSNLVSGSD